MATATQLATKEHAILDKLDRKVAGDLAISSREGGVQFSSMAEVLEFSKLLAVSAQAVPPHCRNQVGICLGITIQAIEWRMSPYAVASKSYVVNDRISYESQLIHAVIEQRAPIRGRLRHEYHGTGDKRTCRVWGVERETGDELSHTSPEISKITPKNSPLWKSKPDIQLYYNTSRDWARIYFPDVILGVYADDELEVFAASHSVPAQAGVQGLKKRLEAIEQQRTEAEEIESGDSVVIPGCDPAIEAGPQGIHEATGYPQTPPSAMTPEELADERNGGLFDKGSPRPE